MRAKEGNCDDDADDALPGGAVTNQGISHRRPCDTSGSHIKGPRYLPRATARDPGKISKARNFPFIHPKPMTLSTSHKISYTA